MRRLAILGCAVLLLAGCVDLETAYGVTDPARGSVNGCSALFNRLSARTSLHRTWQLTPRLENTDLLVHLARRSGLPADDACTWLREWIEDGDRRTAVLILRDGNLAPFLCRRWAGEARHEAATAEELPAAALTALAERLEARAIAEEEPEWAATVQHCPLFAVMPAPRQRPLAVDGLSTPPLAMTAGLAISAEDATALVEAERPDHVRVPWAIQVPFGDGRLVVVANATPLLDGALADRQARRLAAGLLDRLLDPAWPHAHCTWVQELRVRESEPQALNPMLRLFTTDPFRWVAWHGMVLVLLGLWAAAAWLGRREEPRDVRAQRFGAHVDALAGHLRDRRQHAWCARTIARLRGLPAPPPEIRNEARARAWLAEMLIRERKP